MGLFTNLVNRLPVGLADKLAPVGEKLDLAFSDQGPRSRAARAALFTFAARVMSAVVAYGGQVVLARLMGAHDYGIYAIVWVWILVLSTFAGIGYSTGLLRFIPELLAENRLGVLRTVLIKGPLFTLGLCSLVALAGVALVLLAPQLFDQAFVVPIMLAAICLPIMTLMDNQDGVAQAFDWPGLVILPGFLIRPLLILAIFIGIELAGVEASATTAMIATIFGVWITALGQFLILRQRVVAKIGKGPMEGPISPWVKAALPMLAVESFFFLIINTDIMVAGWFVSPEQVAVYYAATKTLALVHFVAFAIRIAMAHKIAEYHASGDQVALDRTLADTIRWTFWPSLAIAVMLALGGEFILSFFGDGFESGMLFLSILLVGIVVRATVGPAEVMLTMANAQKTAAWLYGVIFVINLSLNLILIPTIGLLGAAIATALSMTIEAIFLVIAVRHHLGVISFIGFAGHLEVKKGMRQAQAVAAPEVAS